MVVDDRKTGVNSRKSNQSVRSVRRRPTLFPRRGGSDQTPTDDRKSSRKILGYSHIVHSVEDGLAVQAFPISPDRNQKYRAKVAQIRMVE